MKSIFTVLFLMIVGSAISQDTSIKYDEYWGSEAQIKKHFPGQWNEVWFVKNWRVDVLNGDTIPAIIFYNSASPQSSFTRKLRLDPFNKYHYWSADCNPFFSGFSPCRHLDGKKIEKFSVVKFIDYPIEYRMTYQSDTLHRRVFNFAYDHRLYLEKSKDAGPSVWKYQYSFFVHQEDAQTVSTFIAENGVHSTVVVRAPEGQTTVTVKALPPEHLAIFEDWNGRNDDVTFDPVNLKVTLSAEKLQTLLDWANIHGVQIIR